MAATSILDATAGDSMVYTPEYSPVESGWEGFYSQLGTIYSVKTLDNVYIKVLRYHPAGLAFNTGEQPILLLPGMACNINAFLAQSTPRVKELYPDIALPEDLAAWAVGDENIEKDPMLYYSLAYYLWKSGYDVWMLNYRGVGYGEMKSNVGDISKTTIDTFALYDARAGVNLVYQVTRQHPVVGGHSTGGTVFMMLLEGCYYKWDGHVGSSTSLVNTRNGDTQGAETIKGFIGLEPAGVPVVTSLLDNSLIWSILNSGIALDVRTLVEALDFSGQLSLINMMVGIIDLIGNSALGDAINTYLNLDAENTNEELLYFFMRYAADTMYISMLGQYADWAWQSTIREYYKNGFFNSFLTSPPNPRALDGYYYYVNNVAKWKVPSIFFLGDMENDVFDLVDKDAVIRDYVDGKTTNAHDRCYVVGAAHIDIAMGLCSPGGIFPNIGSWLTEIL